MEETNALSVLLTKTEDVKKWVIKTKQMYQHFNRTSENHDHCLSDNVPELMKLFQAILDDNDKIITVGAYVFDVLLKLLQVPLTLYRYRLKIHSAALLETASLKTNSKIL